MIVRLFPCISRCCLYTGCLCLYNRLAIVANVTVLLRIIPHILFLSNLCFEFLRSNLLVIGWFDVGLNVLCFQILQVFLTFVACVCYQPCEMKRKIGFHLLQEWFQRQHIRWIWKDSHINDEA